MPPFVCFHYVMEENIDQLITDSIATQLELLAKQLRSGEVSLDNIQFDHEATPSYDQKSVEYRLTGRTTLSLTFRKKV